MKKIKEFFKNRRKKHEDARTITIPFDYDSSDEARRAKLKAIFLSEYPKLNMLSPAPSLFPPPLRLEIPTSEQRYQAKLQEILRCVTYKPGFTIQVGGDFMMPTCLQIQAVVPSANFPHEAVPINRRSPVPPDLDERAFLRFVYDNLIQFEIHEVQEWLRCHGLPVVNPHPELLRQKGSAE